MTALSDTTWPAPLAERLASGRFDYHRSDANRHGIAPVTLSLWVKRGFLEALGGGDYVITADTPGDDHHAQRRALHLRRCASILAGTPRLYLVGHSSAVAHALPLLREPTRVEVSARPRPHTQRARVSVRLPWGGTPTLVAGLQCQNVAESLVEIAAQDGTSTGLVPADAALHAGLSTGDDLRHAADRFGARRGAGAARLVAELADGRIESPGESLLRWQAREAGVELVPQVVIREPDGTFVGRVDFVIAGTNVVVEFDGLGRYATADDLRREKLRQVKIERLGYRVVRFTFADLQAGHVVAAALHRYVSTA